jgi:hypothetical protein
VLEETWVVGEDGKRRRPWLFRIVLSCSRKAYSEVVWRQTTGNFIAAIENAFYPATNWAIAAYTSAIRSG